MTDKMYIYTFPMTPGGQPLRWVLESDYRRIEEELVRANARLEQYRLRESPCVCSGSTNGGVVQCSICKRLATLEET